MALSPATARGSQAAHRVAFLAALLFSCFGVARTEDENPLQTDWVDTDGTAVSLRIEDGSLNLYGDGDLVMPDVKFTQFTAFLMLFSTNEDFQNAAESTATSFLAVTGVKRLIGVFNQMAQAERRQDTEAPAMTSEAQPLPSVEWTDTEGDVVSLRGTGGFVALWANGEEVMPNVAGVQLYDDGLSLNFISGEGPQGVMTAVTVARDASDVKMIQDFLTTHAAGTPPGGTPAPEHAQQQQQADALQAFAEFVREQKERQQRSRQRAEIAGIFVEDQKDLAEPRPVVTQYHVLHLGRRTFAQTVLPPTKYPVENWIVMFCYSWYEPCQNIADPYSAVSREWEAKLNQDLFTTHVRFATVDCATDKELCNAQEVEGYPHVKHYSEGAAIAKWTGGRQSDETRLAKWLTKRLGATEKPEESQQSEDSETDPSVVARERGINALLVLGVSALVFRSVCLDSELWKGPAAAPPAAAAQDSPSGLPAGPRGLPSEWARRGSVEL